jgi:hypothetical protein
LSHLERLLGCVVRARLVPVSLTDRLQRELVVLADFLEAHLAEQETWLFPVERLLEETAAGESWCPKAELDPMFQGRRALLARVARVQACLGEPQWSGKGAAVEDFVAGVRRLCAELADFVHGETGALSGPLPPHPFSSTHCVA